MSLCDFDFFIICFLYCYHQSQLKRTRRCKKLNESSITVHIAPELRCIRDDSKSFGFLYPLQHNHSECYQQSQLNRTRSCKKLNESLWTRQFNHMRAAKAKSSLYKCPFSQESSLLAACTVWLALLASCAIFSWLISSYRTCVSNLSPSNLNDSE